MALKLSLCVLLGLLIVAGSIWQPHDPDAVDLILRHAPPSFEYPLGTDHLGRDLASRMMIAGWRSASVVLAVGAIGFLGGSFVGTVAAVAGGWREQVTLRAAELFIVVPTLIWALTAAAVFGLSPMTAGIALGLAGVGPYALLSNSLTHRVLGQPFVHAARGLGVSAPRLMARHVLPNTLPLIFVYVGSQAGQAVVAYASLAFIGLGSDPSKPDWGSMLYEYRLFVFDHPMLMIWPGLAIVVMTALLNWVFEHRSS